jgi:hypothetical protein
MLYLSLLSPESLFVLTGSMLGASEVVIIDFGMVDSIDLYGGARGNHVGLVHTLQGDAIHLVRSRDEEESTLQLLQEHDSLTLETTSQKDHNTPGYESLAETLSLRLTVASHEMDLLIIGLVP